MFHVNISFQEKKKNEKATTYNKQTSQILHPVFFLAFVFSFWSKHFAL